MRIISRASGSWHRGKYRHAAALSIATIAALLLLLPFNLQAAERSAVVLQGLDKVTARISKFTAELDTPVVFGTLEITARACHKKPPEEPPESAAFLEIREKRQGTSVELLFSGWMFASTPGLSALQHPVYDVWVLDCAMLEVNSESNG
ncbi:MAG: DUF2155 domain-containing protein [Proteobacteria bacterium]|nr:DUF2155 domain-containing protein [Pseudomonadota bacterium]MDA1354980.1 DUF2155 domain-containing protein [Pseudomonadota bacterium]